MVSLFPFPALALAKAVRLTLPDALKISGLTTRARTTMARFFALCHRYGGAYTYPDDNDANTLNGGRCRGFQGATCCIGNFCSEWENYPRK
ncbi:hypothetical protein LMH87_001030 [Akanthomyces muscarius]|uniref:Uncharacterized protein n=1 Tax=Akanthomyces muscarius TaxID=2231603 RepID=A0A9W8QGI9_AKAMU|nr:hypothetical protein LMH87_001030 [Akanthomyces muscarius]KAJ4155801.1 hypothetical protein LMH87_001030 [Akanthomyces muscarius]